MKAIFPGSFDPITLGHLDIVNRGAKLFDCVIIALLNNPAKTPLFSIAERITMIKQETEKLPNIQIVEYDGLLAELAKKLTVNCILRGVRNEKDCSYEIAMAQANKTLNNNLDTIFMVSNPNNSYMSASLLKEIANAGYPNFDDSVLDNWVSSAVKQMLKNKYSK
ncbi:MAG: pantetheine-phosphate adenylyltransferase [Firmicutes bacterium]|nr:pantetheine-phosphate adenylyltransferase [Bacillota bacterium]